MMMRNPEGKASAGQPFYPPHHEVWNGMVDAGNAYRANRLSNGVPQPTRPRETDIIKLKNSSSGDRKRGQILRIDGKAITDLSDEYIWLIGQAPLADDYFGILKEPIADGEVGQVQVSGCCIALVDVVDANHTRAKAVAAEYVLESSDDGPIEILYAPSGTGELECVVRFGGSGGGGGVSFFGFKITAITPNVIGEVYAAPDFDQLNPTATGVGLLDPMQMFGELPVNTIGLCVPNGADYLIVVPSCPPEEVTP